MLLQVATLHIECFISGTATQHHTMLLLLPLLLLFLLAARRHLVCVQRLRGGLVSHPCCKTAIGTGSVGSGRQPSTCGRWCKV